MHVTQAVFLAGGRGTRLGELTRNTPKPLLKVGGKPFLDFQLERVKKIGVTDVIIIVDYLGDQIIDRYSSLQGNLGLRIQCVEKAPNSDTAAGLLYAKEKLEDTFFTLNADSFFDFDMTQLANIQTPHDWKGRIALREVPDGIHGGSVVVDRYGHVTEFRERGGVGKTFMNMGVYLFRKAVLQHISSDVDSFERHVFPRMIREGSLYAEVFNGYFIDIGTPERLELARKEFVHKTRFL